MCHLVSNGVVLGGCWCLCWVALVCTLRAACIRAVVDEQPW
jgi:hypothetical protein